MSSWQCPRRFTTARTPTAKFGSACSNTPKSRKLNFKRRSRRGRGGSPW
jgi:hypothetical protein